MVGIGVELLIGRIATLTKLASVRIQGQRWFDFQRHKVLARQMGKDSGKNHNGTHDESLSQECHALCGMHGSYQLAEYDIDGSKVPLIIRIGISMGSAIVRYYFCW